MDIEVGELDLGEGRTYVSAACVLTFFPPAALGRDGARPILQVGEELLRLRPRLDRQTILTVHAGEERARPKAGPSLRPRGVQG